MSFLLGCGGPATPAAAARPSGGGGVAAGVSSGAPGIQYFGRWDHTDPENPSGSWGPVGLRARFQGTRVGLKLQDTQNTFTYSIDATKFTTLGPSHEGELELASGLEDQEHTLTLFRRSEGGYGKTVISGLVLDPNRQLLPPPRRPARRLEFLGDSISAGFGNEGQGGNAPTTQNGYLAFGPQLARLLDAEWSVIAHSGQGVYRNLCEALPPTAAHMPDEFKLAQHPLAGAGSAEWNFQSWQPDVLVIALGTNDFADYPAGSCAPPDADAFQAAYQDLLRLARSKYPSAEIFALGTFIATPSNAFGTCNQRICAAVSALGDPHAHCVDPATGKGGPWLSGPSDYGDWTHPTVAGHTKIATKLREAVAPALGW